jgi:cytochrome b561
MVAASTRRSYDSVQRTFHWLMAAIILVAIVLGLVAYFLPKSEGALFLQVLYVHKSLGITALVLGVLRIVYRLIVGAPQYAVALGRLTRMAAHAAHLALYALMIAMPVTGYVASSASGHEIPWFGLFNWPSLAPRDAALSNLAVGAHFWLAWGIIGVLVLHFAAVAWHTFIKRDEVLSRMWPSATHRKAPVSGARGSVV